MERETLDSKITKLADNLAFFTYPLTYKFPREERFALGDQIRRAVVSVPANIIEGIARGGLKEKRQFYNISYASLKEVKYLVHLANRLKLISDQNYLIFQNYAEELSKLLFTFIRILKNNTN